MAEKRMLEGAADPDDERLARMMHFYALWGFVRGLEAADGHYDGDMESVVAAANEIENIDYKSIFSIDVPEPEPDLRLN